MSEREVLLKIKREFSNNEIIQLLFKKISDLEFEIGILRSERDEALEKVNKIHTGDGQIKKAWLKDELVARMDEEIKQNQKRNTEMRKQLEEWKEKYFALYLKLNDKKD